MSRQIVVGREAFSLAHLKVFRREEVEKFMGDVAGELISLASNAIIVFKPVRLEITFCGGRHVIPAGLTHVRGVQLEIPGALYLPGYLDEEYLEYLLFDLPRELDERRNPVVVEDCHRRFTRWVQEGLVYSFDVLSRIARVYRVPVIVYGDSESEKRWSFARTFSCEKVEGREVCFVDGKPCGGGGASPD
ncbi:MAG: hypothetical protein LM590_00445 [Thermofilum sp.]|nr:hypothetical protein [Thermofilum sp.]